jgi:hypothetical protein
MIKNKASFTWLFIPLTIYLALMVILFIERSGIRYEIKQSDLGFLEPSAQPMPSGYTEPAVESLILHDSNFPEEQVIVQTLTETLDSMRVRYDKADLNGSGEFEFQKYKTVIIAFHDLAQLQQLHELVDWVEAGGRVLVATHPGMSEDFSSIYRKMGIQKMQNQNIQVLGVAFTTDLLPGAKGIRIEGTENFLNNSSYPVELDDSSRVHITSADEYNVPLLWEKDFGQGRFIIINTDQFSNRLNRGILGAAYSLLQDAFVYPVINSSVYFIDDFPAPIPEGYNPVITQEFNVDIRSFLVNIWWPDMQRLADKYQIEYTGLFIETYNYRLTPPFEMEVSMDDHRYLGSLLLKRGGEIGLHGYNHVPFCLPDEGVNEIFDYPYWPSAENGQMAIQTLDQLGRDLFPGSHYLVYVPPSNILCPEARRWLPKVLPELRVISSLLLEDEGEETYIQNFEEADDGIIEFPRVVSGYFLYEYAQLALINELGLHYVNSHFIHPDDILDPERREDRSWEQMRQQLDQQLMWLTENTPGLRQMIVSEGAMAIQRFDRLKVNAVLEENNYSIHLADFYDEAWLMLRTSQEPVYITGGSITKVTSSLYLIKAEQPDVFIQLRKQP